MAFRMGNWGSTHSGSRVANRIAANVCLHAYRRHLTKEVQVRLVTWVMLWQASFSKMSR